MKPGYLSAMIIVRVANRPTIGIARKATSNCVPTPIAEPCDLARAERLGPEIASFDVPGHPNQHQCRAPAGSFGNGDSLSKAANRPTESFMNELQRADPRWLAARERLQARYGELSELVDASRLSYLRGPMQHFSEAEFAEIWAEAARDPNRPQNAQHSVYIHVPFCKSICSCNYERLRPSRPGLLDACLTGCCRPSIRYRRRFEI